MTSATCFHSSSCCSFLSFSSHLSSFLSMVEETFSSTRNTLGSTLSTIRGRSLHYFLYFFTIMILPLFSGSRSHEWMSGPRLLSVTVCPLLYPHSCPDISNGILYRYFSSPSKGERGGINYYQNCGLQEACSLLAVKCFAKTRTVISYQSGSVL